MKTCRRCNRSKSLSEFHKLSRSPDGHQARCKECACATARQHYLDNIEVRRAGVYARVADTKAFVDAQKIGKPCHDCGVSYPPYVMDFDHRPGETKLFGVSVGRRKGRSIAMLLAEIAKCDLVCANCHRIRTHDRLAVS